MIDCLLTLVLVFRVIFCFILPLIYSATEGIIFFLSPRWVLLDYIHNMDRSWWFLKSFYSVCKGMCVLDGHFPPMYIVPDCFNFWSMNSPKNWCNADSFQSLYTEPWYHCKGLLSRRTAKNLGSAKKKIPLKYYHSKRAWVPLHSNVIYRQAVLLFLLQ